MIGADPRQTRKLLLGARPGAVVCTHREVIDALLGRRVRCEKAGVLVLQRNAGDLNVLDYMPSPVRENGARPVEGQKKNPTEKSENP